MATKTDIELKIVDSVDTSHTEAEVLTDSAANPDAFYLGRGYLAHNGKKVIEGIDPNGSYPNMTVGNAQKAKEAESATHADTATDLSGRVEATPEVFTYRPSAGEKSIKDDNAFIRRVKGNSVVWNQLLYATKWETDSVNGTVNRSDDYSEITHISAGNNNTVYIYASNIKYSSREGHIMYFYAEVSKGYSFYACKTRPSDGFTYSPIVKVTNDGLHTPLISFYKNDGSNFEAGEEITIKNIVMFDLTQMFGIGNEPTTVEEFRELYPDSYYPHNTGELRNLNCYGIKTVGFNEFNGTYARVLPNKTYYLGGEYTSIAFATELGGTTEAISLPSDRLYIPTQLGYIYASGANININLHHTGWRDGEYEPYKEVTHSLPLSQITNGEPLRKAGSVYDEINETHYIKRVGVVDLGSLSWFASTATPADNITNQFFYAQIDGLQLGYGTITISAPYDEIDIHPNSIRSKDKTIYCTDNYVGGNSPTAVIIRDSSYNDTASFKTAMSGVMLNYKLAEPIVTPIETPIDFNYYVEDFGTEEALLAEDSAPFSADIVYQFNAVDNIRQNRISIQKLNDIFSGSKGEYVRADGSWGYIADLKGNFFVKPTLKRIRTGISELSDTIQIIHPYLTEHVGDAKIVLMAVKRRGGTYYDRATNAKGRRKKRKAWGELHYAAMPNTELNHNTIEMPNGASFEAWQGVILTACGRIPEGLENAREPYNVNVASEDLADFFAANGAIFVGKTPVIRLGVALRIPNPNFIDYGNGKKMWDYNDVTGKWEYKYLYSDVAEVVVKSQMLSTGGYYVLGLELV